MAYIGEIYTAKIFYQDDEENYKVRPILVLNNTDNNFITIAEITSIPPKNPPSYYDKFKELIIKWKQAGLNEPSYIKCKNVYNIENILLYDFIGVMELSDFINIINKINDYNI